MDSGLDRLMDLTQGSCEIPLMVGGAEGIGDAVTGGMLARAVEPQTGEAKVEGEPGSPCLNCGTPLIGGYCHNCGQAAHVHRSLAAFWHDVAHSVLHFEGKIWRTLPLLAWRPGELTRRYVEGERARFVSPMALFLFSVFLMFALFSAVGGPFHFNPKVDPKAQHEIRASRDAAARDLAELQRRRTALAARGADTRGIDRDIVQARSEAGVLNMVSGAAEGGEPEGLRIEGLSENGGGWLNESYKKAKENPSLLGYKLQTNAYKFSWALIPISVPFVWLLFLWRGGYKLYDHTVFVTYSITFMSLLVIALSVANAIGVAEGVIFLALLLVPPFHMYRQLKGAYRLSRFSAAWRTVFLMIFAVVASILFFLLLVAIGVMH